ncbi:Lrp/AsnC ligand binding domain-containing protein [Candidatus Oleimmundimicrobium sp.]|uniref:Lrp/AsnC ligand binding domain-containing protein n=1 Tax=Candidatus Oleimmundimicrobium sp. TaxID=3060597 RepID=UPI00272134F6|nr:Lrp/AsnC ligand binding domain-containing protein [Candidatus Oleimmundimicrobium sp.]MDO8885639.1 Lrp/AsnC ligand binding domain-containing protein [Candidatus Oleimmundimicrobium sp.]
MVNAYILITAEAGEAGNIVKQAKKIEGVTSIDAVTGPYDAITFVEAPDFNTLGNLVVAKIQKIKGVIRTLTCILVEL